MAGSAGIVVTGYLAVEPEVKSVGEHKVCEFSIPVSPNYKDKEHTNWYRIAVWGKRGQQMGDLLGKGSFVTVAGTLNVRDYEGKNGPGYSLDVRADQITLGPKPGHRGQGDDLGDIPGPSSDPF